MSALPLIRFADAVAASALPREPGWWRKLHHLEKVAGRGGLPWLQGAGPDGRPGRWLWIDIQAAAAWFAARGQACVGRALVAVAVQRYGYVPEEASQK